MKQKLFLSALVLGALTFNSCVDDTESPSVTAIRQAKAEQLSALAYSAKTEADAAKLMAETDAAYKTALAAYEQAKADAENARTEKERAEAQVAIEKAKLELQNLAAQNEVTLAKLKVELQKAMNDLSAAINQADADKRGVLNALYYDYNDAANILVEDQEKLAEANAAYATWRTNYAWTISNNKYQIALLEKDIADEEENIAKYQEEIATIEKYKGDVDAAQKALDAANEELTALNKTKGLADHDEGKAKYAQDEAKNAYDNSVYLQKVEEVKRFSYSDYSNYYICVGVVPHRVNNQTTGADEGKYALFMYDYTTMNESYVVLFNNENANELILNETEGNVNNIVSYKQYENPYKLVENGSANLKKFLGKVSEKALKDYNDAKKAYADAKKVVDDAGDKATQAQKDAMELALQNEAIAESTYETIAEDLNPIQENYDALAPQVSNWEGYVKALNEANLSYAKAELAQKVAKTAVDMKGAEVNGLQIVLNTVNNADQNGNNGYLDRIEILENLIKTSQYQINFYNDQIKAYEVVKGSYDETIEWYENQIAQLKLKIEQDQSRLDIAKANLQEALEAQGE